MHGSFVTLIVRRRGPDSDWLCWQSVESFIIKKSIRDSHKLVRNETYKECLSMIITIHYHYRKMLNIDIDYKKRINISLCEIIEFLLLHYIPSAWRFVARVRRSLTVRAQLCKFDSSVIYISGQWDTTVRWWGWWWQFHEERNAIPIVCNLVGR